MCRHAKRTDNNAGRVVTQQCQKHGVRTGTTLRELRRSSVRRVNVRWEIQSAEKDRMSRVIQMFTKYDCLDNGSLTTCQQHVQSDMSQINRHR